MAYSKKQKQKIFDDICDLLVSGKSLRTALKEVNFSYKTFYEWIREDKNKSEQYARATIERAELMFEDMLDIADKIPELTKTKFGTSIDTGDVQHQRLRVDTRKWALSKMMPKKYGNASEANDKDEDSEITIKIVE